MTALRRLPGVVVRKRHGTVMGVAGDPDLYGTFNGRHFEIEVKRPGDPSSQLSELQTQRLMEWRLAGAITGVARCVDDALAILGRGQPARPELRLVWRCEGCGDYAWEGPEPPERCPNCRHRHFSREEASQA